MPLIDIHVLEGVFTPEEKAAMIRACAQGFGSVAGPAMERATSVRVHEVPSGAWGGSDSVWTTETALELKRSQ
ncbi:MAG: tautomerase family protein [Pseudomonadota bacterium]